MKLKTILQISEWISHGIAVNRNPDSKLRPTPGGWNDGAESWDGITEGKDWFCYVEGNNHDKKLTGATIYINEDGKTYKVWAKIKTGRLRKPNDTNEAYRERIRKHANKVAKSWMSGAKKIHNNPDLNEVGNVIPISWKTSFLEALKDSKLRPYLADCGQAEIDSVNFTPRR